LTGWVKVLKGPKRVSPKVGGSPQSFLGAKGWFGGQKMGEGRDPKNPQGEGGKQIWGHTEGGGTTKMRNSGESTTHQGSRTKKEGAKKNLPPGGEG